MDKIAYTMGTKNFSLSPVTEKRLFQLVVTLACAVPIFGGAHGILLGIGRIDNLPLDNHFRYLSGLLLGIGFGFISTVPHIDKHTKRFRLLTFIVLTGGIGRLAGMFLAGIPNSVMLFALVMELCVTPLLCLWQQRIARKFQVA